MGTKDFSEDFKGLKITENQDINILLLGETGVGKSTFINSIANYLHYKRFKKALKEEPLILIPAVVTVTDHNYEQVTIKVGSDSNEFQEVGAAATQDVKTYVFPMGQGKTRLRLIDTPGMGDPRGIEQDDINCENILAYLGQLKELHAICFLMKPTHARLTVFFEYCVNQILSRLEKSASRNIVFIFTNTRGTNYTPGETLPCLKKVVEEIKAKPPHVDIPIQDNIFSFDNEAFRFLIALKHDIKFVQSVQERFIESWENSSKECWRLISYILGDASRDPLKPHQMENTISINEARRLIVRLSQPLADISQLIYDNIRILEKHKFNLKIENQSLDELKKKMYIPIINLEVTQLTQPVTVCTSTKCADIVKVGDVNKWHYRQRCHDPCYLTNVAKEHIGDPSLMHCAAMSGRNCVKCTCDFSVHMHVYYMTKTIDDKIVDAVVQNNIHRKETALREAERLITEIDRRKKELEEERDTVIRSTAQFAHFLQQNAISPFSDSYKAYIEYLISREKNLGQNADQGAINNLEQLLQQYNEIKAAFDNSVNLGDQHGLDALMSSVTPQKVLKTIHDLYQLKHNGKKIHELLKKQKASRTSEFSKNCEYVHPKSSVYEDKPKKDKKKEGKSTDDEKKSGKQGQSKTDKRKDGAKTDDEKHTFKKGSFIKNHISNRDNRTNNSERQFRSPSLNTRNFVRQDPPPPYPGHYTGDKYSTATQEKSNDQPNVVVKVELNQPSKHKLNTDGSRNPQFSHQDPHFVQSYHQDGYYDRSPGSLHCPPLHSSYYNQPVQGSYHGPPPQGSYHGPPSQGSYHGHSTQGSYYPPHEPHRGPQGSYERPSGQQCGPDCNSCHGPPQGYHKGYSQDQYHGPSENYYHHGHQSSPQDYQGPPQGYQGPPQGYQGPPRGYQGPPRGYQGPPQGYENRPKGHYQSPSRGQYHGTFQKSNESSRRGRPYNQRGGQTKRGRSETRVSKDKKSGNEKTSSNSDSSD